MKKLMLSLLTGVIALSLSVQTMASLKTHIEVPITGSSIAATMINPIGYGLHARWGAGLTKADGADADYHLLLGVGGLPLGTNLDVNFGDSPTSKIGSADGFEIGEISLNKTFYFDLTDAVKIGMHLNLVSYNVNTKGLAVLTDLSPVIAAKVDLFN